MRKIRKSTAAAVVGLAALALVATPTFAAGDQNTAKAGTPAQVAHMGQGAQGKSQPCPMGMMGPGMMAPGMGSQGKFGPHGMMPPGTGGQGMMGPGTGGQGMMGPGFGKGAGLGSQVVPSKDLTADDVRHFLEHRLQMEGNKRLKVGEVKESDDNEIIADITTVDGALVRRLEVDRHTGQMRDVE